jgi:outer membrane protein assembly factor BamB/tetratricopeptide (TPR) repeat protein
VNTVLRILACGILLGGIPGAAPPQEDDPVFVDESKKDYLDKLERYLKSKDWKALFDHHAQASLPRNAHKVVPLAPNQYVGLAEYLKRRFADLPPEALQYYRGQHDGPARREFDRARAAGDLEALDRLVDTWFYSSRTDDTLDLLGNLHLEEGRPREAAHCWKRLLMHYPDSEIPRALTAARLGRAAEAWGNGSLLAEVRKFVKSKGIEGEVIAGGERKNLSDYLAGLKAERPAAAVSTSDRMPSIPGPEARFGKRLVGVRSEVRRWTYDLAPETKPRPAGGGRQGRQTAALPPSDFPFLPAHAVVGGYEMVVFTNGLRVVAVDPSKVNSARPEEGVYFSYPEVPDAQLRPVSAQNPWGGTNSVTRPYIGVTLDGDHAFATLYSDKRGQTAAAPGPAMAQMDIFQGTTRLVCINLRTQEVQWDSDYKGLPDPYRKLEFWERNFSFCGPPLVRGDRVYVGICTSPMGEEEGRVLCLDRRTGIPLWERFLVSVNATRMWFGGSMNYVSHLTMLEEDRGILFAHTNLGVLAALDAVSGRILWLTKYPRVNPQYNRNTGQYGGEFNRPAASPLVLYRDKIFALPQDRVDLLTFDPGTGALLPNPPCKAVSEERDWRSFYRLVGMMQNFMVLGGAGNTESFVLNVDEGIGYNLMTTQVSGTGQGWIDGETLYLPTMVGGKGGLTILHGVRSWRPFDQVPWWPLNEGGNVLRGGNYLVYASATRLSIFADSETVKAEFQRRLRQNPPNPAAYLEYGDLMRINDRWSEAAESYLTFIEAAAGDPAWMAKTREVKTGLHAIFLKRGREAEGPGRLEEAAAHFRSARDFSWDEPTYTEAARQLAWTYERIAEKHTESSERLAAARRAVEEYQNLVRRARTGFLRTEEGVALQKTWKHASARIAALVEKYGAGAYETVEAAAREEFRKAAGLGPDALKEVVDLYPDSAAAFEALSIIVATAAKEGRWDRVASGLRDLRERYPKRWTPELQKRLNDALEKLGDTERLRNELNRTEKLFRGAKIRIDGDEIEVAAYVEKARGGLEKKRPVAPPRLGPLKSSATWEPAQPADGARQLAVGYDLLVPGGLEPPKWSGDLEFFARGSAVELWNVREKKRVWSAAHPGGWTGIVYGTRPEGPGVRVVYVFPGSPGERAGLRVGDAILTLNGAEAREETLDQLPGAGPGARLACSILRDGATKVVKLEPSIWPAFSRPGIVGAVFTGDYTLAVAWEDAVASFDLADGKTRWVSRPVRDRFVLSSLDAVEGRLVVFEKFAPDNRARSPLRDLGTAPGPASLPAEDWHSRILCLDESDGEAAWACAFRFDPGAAALHAVRVVGDPSDESVALIATGIRENLRFAELCVLSVADGKELRRISLATGGGSSIPAIHVEPVTRTLWMIEAQNNNSSRLLKNHYLQAEQPADFQQVEQALDGFTDPRVFLFGFSATPESVAVVSVPADTQGSLKLTVFSAKNGQLLASLKSSGNFAKDRSADFLKDRTLGPAQSGELRFLEGLVTVDSEGFVYLYNESKPASGSAKRAWITAFRVTSDKYCERVWEAVAPRMKISQAQDLADVSVHPSTVLVTTYAGTLPNETESQTVAAFYDRKNEGYLKRTVTDLVIPRDSFNRALEPVRVRRGRVFLNRKGGLEILSD